MPGLGALLSSNPSNRLAFNLRSERACLLEAAGEISSPLVIRMPHASQIVVQGRILCIKIIPSISCLKLSPKYFLPARLDQKISITINNCSV